MNIYISQEGDRLRKADVMLSMSAISMLALHVIHNPLIEDDIGEQRIYH